MEKWEAGLACLFSAIDSITKDYLTTTIYIRNQGHTVVEAINRQLAHYPYHVGQIVFIGKMLLGREWTSLSIPKGASNQFNQEMFAKSKK